MTYCRWSVTTTYPRTIEITLLQGETPAMGVNARCGNFIGSIALKDDPGFYFGAYTNYCAYPAEQITGYFLVGCEAPPPSSGYDCLNGNCIQASVYNTPGQYSTLADCQAGCGSGGQCPPGQICVEQACLDAVYATLQRVDTGLN
jgi:hypothetical protein